MGIVLHLSFFNLLCLIKPAHIGLLLEYRAILSMAKAAGLVFTFWLLF